MTIIVTAEVVLILNISWNFVLGMAGVWNFGQLAIYALGAYGAGWLMLHADLDARRMIAILCGGLFSAGDLGAAGLPDAAPVRHLHVAADVLVRPGGAVRRPQRPARADRRLLRLPDGARPVPEHVADQRSCALTTGCSLP